jgi:hypothetical protein
MKKPLAVSIILALALLMGSFTPVYSQAPTPSDTPTFYHLVPGTYVNGYPRFTIHYPTDWVERRPDPVEVFRASAPGPNPVSSFAVAYWQLSPDCPALDKLAEELLSFNRRRSMEVTLISDKPTQLRDGTPAREIEFRIILSGAPLYTMPLATRKDDMLINTIVNSTQGRVREDLKAILYSREHQPDKDKPVKVSPDVQQFLDDWRNDIVSHDLAKVMTHYSDRYLDSVEKKAEVEQFWKQVVDHITSFEVGITDLVAEGEKVHLAGFWSSYLGKRMLRGSPIIKENGEWKFYGNQRDPAPMR